MGSAYPTIASDAVARFQRLQGRQVAFVTGTDEHGEKIALAAHKRGMAPKEHCDDIVASYKGLWQQVGGRCPADVTGTCYEAAGSSGHRHYLWAAAAAAAASWGGGGGRSGGGGAAAAPVAAVAAAAVLALVRLCWWCCCCSLLLCRFDHS